jgi:hypothetical protein
LLQYILVGDRWRRERERGQRCTGKCMSVHGATPYYCRWVFEAIAIVGTVAPANRRLYFQKRWLQLKFVRAFSAFARKIFKAKLANEGASLLHIQASHPVCLVNIA